ncbi:hypothetical protein FUA26_11980 [Seonamhaeicola algicola]|uniref:Lipoprotein n=1 Tax=Seonamhaeicola algicola TaxID=1719036 RepID=A0A5C7AH29_9FLAO|nr:hypothetical protein [Seonamhaeicola algicola]TXE08116.1 hypothetical protein FUA26_11980 [Seonamhaeicola algicola]
MKRIIFGILILTIFVSCGKENKFVNWTEKEKSQYEKLTELAEYVDGKQKSEISKDLLFDKYIEFDYVLKDTSETRKESRIQSFDTLFYYFRKPIDSIGIKNLDAKPVRFFNEHEIYKPFEKQLAEIEPNVFAYYEKKEPENPKGVLWFDQESDKLIAWILLNQGGTRYFLSFNLM